MKSAIQLTKRVSPPPNLRFGYLAGEDSCSLGSNLTVNSNDLKIYENNTLNLASNPTFFLLFYMFILKLRYLLFIKKIKENLVSNVERIL